MKKLGKSVGIVGIVMLSACTMSQRPVLPPPPAQPELVDQSAQSIQSGFLLSAEDVTKLQQLAGNGDRDAAFRLSFHFMSSGDQKRANFWQLLAARRGHPVAQYNQWFALRYEKDCASMKKALAWLKASADSGYRDALNSIEHFERKVRSCSPR